MDEDSHCVYGSLLEPQQHIQHHWNDFANAEARHCFGINSATSSCCDRGGNNWSKARKKRRKQDKGNLIIAPLPNSGQESQSLFTVEKRRRACCIGLAVQAGVHNPHGSGHKSDNCRLQKAGMAFTREKQQHTA